MKDLTTGDDAGTGVTIHRLTIPTSAGPLEARILRPEFVGGVEPLVVLHGISRNASELAALFAVEAARTGRLIVVPHFDARRWPHFQRPCRAARPDLALAGLLEHLRGIDPAFRRPVALFGHSGGAQLAHRFGMLYPHKVARLSLAAAGWYCLPDDRMAYPYGLGAGNAPGAALWVRRHRAGLDRFLTLPIEIFVGTRDVQRDDSLRQTPRLDAVQGRTRLERARTYAEALRLSARARGLTPRVTFTELDGIDHDVARAIREAGLARLVAGAARRGLSHAL